MYMKPETDSRPISDPNIKPDVPPVIVRWKAPERPIITSPIYRDRFTERLNQIPDKLEYPRNGDDPGLVIIFNHEKFQSDHSQRKGTRNDVEELIQTFGRLKFNIDENSVYTDLSRGEILKTIKKICEMDLSQRNCLIVIFLTHGEENDQLAANDAKVNIKEIWEEFANCEDLKNKPKLFIFQACKGVEGITLQQKANAGDSFKLFPSNIFVSPLQPDMMIVYATLEGKVSFRAPENGTWFIQELCRNFNAYGRRDDVVSLIIRTTKCVATYYSTDKNDVYKQMPMFITTLTKNFYLTKSKERNNTLGIKETDEEILKRLKDLKARLEKLEK